MEVRFWLVGLPLLFLEMEVWRGQESKFTPSNQLNLARGKVAAHFKPVLNENCRLVAPPPTRRTAVGGYPKVASYDMLGEQLHYSNPVKHG